MKNNHYYFSKFYKQINAENEFKSRYDKNRIYRYKDFTSSKIESHNKSLIILGCSIAWGVGLEDYQTISYKLSKVLKSTVYNRAFIGTGYQDIIYLFSDKLSLEKMNKEPEYILYFYNPDHLRRMIVRTTSSNKISYPYLFYRNKDNKLVQSKLSILEDFYFVDFIKNRYFDNKIHINFLDKKLFNLFCLHMETISLLIKEKFPKTKFVIIRLGDSFIRNYDDYLDENYDVIDLPKETGIKLMDYYGKINEYTVDKSCHPSEKYWDTVLPIILKKLESPQ